MKNRTPTLAESLGDYAIYGFTIHKPNRGNVKRIKRARKCTLNEESKLKKAA